MKEIRSKQSSPKLQRGANKALEACCSEQYPWLSFRYMTSNAQHSIKFLDSIQGKEKDITLDCLYSRLEEITKSSWSYWLNSRKSIGLETIEYQQLKFEAGGDINLAKDFTIYVFRCDTYKGSKQGRIIGFKSSPCSTFHIIGYDFDFSAYHHGS